MSKFFFPFRFHVLLLSAEKPAFQLGPSRPKDGEQVSNPEMAEEGDGAGCAETQRA